MALSGIMIERGRPAWWGLQSTDHTDLPLHGDIFLTWSNAYWWGHYMTQHSHPCIIHGETCSDSIVDRCSTLNKNMFNPIFVKILTQTSKHSPPPPQHKKALAQSSWAPSVCARVFENFQTLDLRMFWMLPVHTTSSLLVTSYNPFFRFWVHGWSHQLHSCVFLAVASLVCLDVCSQCNIFLKDAAKDKQGMYKTHIPICISTLFQLLQTYTNSA
jgi:hypothetical protein